MTMRVTWTDPDDGTEHEHRATTPEAARLVAEAVADRHPGVLVAVTAVDRGAVQ